MVVDEVQHGKLVANHRQTRDGATSLELVYVWASFGFVSAVCTRSATARNSKMIYRCLAQLDAATASRKHTDANLERL